MITVSYGNDAHKPRFWVTVSPTFHHNGLFDRNAMHDDSPILREAVEHSPGRVLSATTRRILVVDDNREGADTWAALLQHRGNHVATAYDGAAAIHLGESFHPDVMLLDLGLPRMNGCDVARLVRASSWGSRVLLIAITGSGHDEDRRLTRDAGFDHHLVKPIDLLDLERLMT